MHLRQDAVWRAGGLIALLDWRWRKWWMMDDGWWIWRARKEGRVREGDSEIACSLGPMVPPLVVLLWEGLGSVGRLQVSYRWCYGTYCVLRAFHDGFNNAIVLPATLNSNSSIRVQFINLLYNIYSLTWLLHHFIHLSTCICLLLRTLIITSVHLLLHHPPSSERLHQIPSTLHQIHSPPTSIQPPVQHHS